MDSTAKNKMLLYIIGSFAVGVVAGIIINRMFPSTSSTSNTTATGSQVTTQPAATVVTTTQPTV